MNEFQATEDALSPPTRTSRTSRTETQCSHITKHILNLHILISNLSSLLNTIFIKTDWRRTKMAILSNLLGGSADKLRIKRTSAFRFCLSMNFGTGTLLTVTMVCRLLLWYADCYYGMMTVTMVCRPVLYYTDRYHPDRSYAYGMLTGTMVC